MSVRFAMLHFDFLERRGVRIAGFTECHDGDFSNSNPCADISLKKLVSAAISSETPVELVMPIQVHGTQIAVVDGSNPSSRPDGTDGLLTDKRDIVLCVLTADCVPLFLFDPIRRVIGLVHAGRKGILEGIPTRSVQLMVEHYGTDPESILAFVGPSACPRCYEVSEEIVTEWSSRELPHRGRFLDLWGATVQQLQRTGVLFTNMGASNICTIDDTRFFSYRRNHTFQRNAAIIML